MDGSGDVSPPPFDPDDLPLSSDGQYVLLTDTFSEEEAPPTKPEPSKEEVQPEQEVEVESEA